MTSDLKGFSKRIKQIGSRVEVNTNLLKKNTAKYISSVLTTDATPVKTGQARNNWVASVGSPKNILVKSTEFDKTGRERESENARTIDTTKPDQDIFIQNGLPYIKRLNEGSSKQAPAGFVESAVQLANALIKKARLVGVTARVE